MQVARHARELPRCHLPAQWPSLFYFKFGRANRENGLLRALEYATFPVSTPNYLSQRVTLPTLAAWRVASHILMRQAPST
jgi:hypothetical protein